MNTYHRTLKTIAVLAFCIALSGTFSSARATVIPRPEKPKLDDDSVFNKILAKYKGKVVYVDLWAPWCVPCMKEMPNVATLAADLKGKNIAFVFFCIESKNEDRDAAIAKLKIPGDHYSLNLRQYTSLRDGFKVEGIPHYYVVDKSGKIKDKDAKWPSEKGLKEELIKLTKD